MLFKGIFALFFTFGIFSVVRFIIHRTPKPTVKDVGMKAVASLPFVMASSTIVLYSLSKFTADNPACLNNGIAVFLLTVGMFFGFVGDVLLDLKCVYSKESDFFLKRGFASFILGHLFYTISLIYSGNLFEKKTVILILIGVSVIIAFITINIEKILRVEFGKYKPIAALYSGIIFLAVNVSILNITTNGFDVENILIYLGLLSILGSDAVLNGTYFGKNKNTKKDIVFNHILYYFGQYSIVLSAYFLIK